MQAQGIPMDDTLCHFERTTRHAEPLYSDHAWQVHRATEGMGEANGTAHSQNEFENYFAGMRL